MASSSKFEQLIEAKSAMPEKVKQNLLSFYRGYHQALHHVDPADYQDWFETFIKMIENHMKTPFIFQPYHERIRFPQDYYKFGNDFFRLLVDAKHSKVNGHAHIEEILGHLKKKHNVILLANHQIEADPQAISLLLDPKYPGFAEEIIFAAGERVVTDPLAVPFSMGRNLLCIYSKRYIDHPPEKKAEKLHHNKRAMEVMRLLLQEGGKCIYVAPSGGRDRKNAQGVVEVAKFDPQSVEMFYLMAQKAKTPTYFYPMALATYDLFPPPETIQIELGETRRSKHGPIHLAIGPVIDMEQYPGYDEPDKHERRKARADHIWNLVCSDYQKLVRDC